MSLQAIGIHRTFSEPVLRGVDLSVASGSFVTLAGPSGSGKSALLAVLCGFDRPDHGSVLIDGVAVAGPPSWSACAVLPQSLGLAGELTLAENVALPLRLSPERPPVEQRVKELLVELGIDELADRYPAEVSFGQQQRAALARAVIATPRVVLADEPTAHLDAGTTPAAIAVLRRAASEGAAVLVATHHDDVHAAADHTLYLQDGVIAG